MVANTGNSECTFCVLSPRFAINIAFLFPFWCIQLCPLFLLHRSPLTQLSKSEKMRRRRSSDATLSAYFLPLFSDPKGRFGPPNSVAHPLAMLLIFGNGVATNRFIFKAEFHPMIPIIAMIISPVTNLTNFIQK